MQNCFEILVWAIFPQMYLEFIINTAPQGSNSVNGREKYFNIINFTIPSVQWSHGPVVRSRTFFRWRKLGCRFNSRRGYFQFFFCCCLIVFLPFGFLLFILTADLLASRDFCENVSLVSIEEVAIRKSLPWAKDRSFASRRGWEDETQLGYYTKYCLLLLLPLNSRR